MQISHFVFLEDSGLRGVSLFVLTVQMLRACVECS